MQCALIYNGEQQRFRAFYRVTAVLILFAIVVVPLHPWRMNISLVKEVFTTLGASVWTILLLCVASKYLDHRPLRFLGVWPNKRSWWLNLGFGCVAGVVGIVVAVGIAVATGAATFEDARALSQHQGVRSALRFEPDTLNNYTTAITASVSVERATTSAAAMAVTVLANAAKTTASPPSPPSTTTTTSGTNSTSTLVTPTPIDEDEAGSAQNAADEQSIGLPVVLVMSLVVIMVRVVAEEVLLRGYILHNVMEGLTGRGEHMTSGAIAACVITSLLWAIASIAVTPNTNAAPLLLYFFVIIFTGIIAGLIALVSGSVALVVGIRFAWTFIEHSVLGLPETDTGSSNVFGDPLHSMLISLHVSSPTVSGGFLGLCAGAVGPPGLLVAALLVGFFLQRIRGPQLGWIHVDTLSNSWLGGLGRIQLPDIQMEEHSARG